MPETFVISTRVRRGETSGQPLPAAPVKIKKASKAKLKLPAEQAGQIEVDDLLPEPETYVIAKRQVKHRDQEPVESEMEARSPAAETFTIAKRVMLAELEEPISDSFISLERTPKAQLKLRDYQEECIAAVMTAYEGGSMAQIIEMPTGVCFPSIDVCLPGLSSVCVCQACH